MKNNSKLLYLVELALFIAIVLVMKIMGLSAIHVGPLNMTLTMVPIAIGAMLLGPLAGGILGTVYGFTSFYDAITGGSVMTGIFFQINPVLTFILCVVLRAAVGVLTGFIFKGLRSVDKTDTICYFASGLAAPLLNTLLFMGFIILFFYRTDYIQEKVVALGATNPFSFVVLMVGVQGLIEAATGMIIGGGVAKALAHILKIGRRKKAEKAEK